eukprot:COSAG02_NODE_3102_length_7368_cov_92.599120_6_plen_84_part_00
MQPEKSMSRDIMESEGIPKAVRMNYHWVQEAVVDGFIDPRRVPTKDNTSDVFTKTLGADDINRLRPGLTGYGPLPSIPEPMPT